VVRVSFAKILLGITTMFFVSGLHALTVVQLTDEQLSRKAEIIVVGKVLSAHYEVDSKDKKPYTYVHIQVSEALKGKNVSRELTLKTLGGLGSKLGMHVPGAADFYRNEEVLLFLERRSDGSLLPIGLSLGKYSIYRDEQSGKKVVIRTMDGNGKYLSEPRESNIRDLQPDQKKYLDNFRQEIRQFIQR
jgi:hypothetical protein